MGRFPVVLLFHNYLFLPQVASFPSIRLQQQLQKRVPAAESHHAITKKRSYHHQSSALLLAKQEPNVPNYCSQCGSANMVLRVPEGDERLRACCDDCGAVVYVNPKVVVACVVRQQQLQQSDEQQQHRILLAKRSIEPRLGYWGIPQGYLELGETTREGACREALEEVGVTLHPDDLRLRAVYNVPGSVQLVYEALMSDEDCAAMEKDLPTSTLESSEIGFFEIDNLPELCFPTVQWALDHCCAINATEDPCTNVVEQRTKLYNAERNEWSEKEDVDEYD